MLYSTSSFFSASPNGCHWMSCARCSESREVGSMHGARVLKVNDYAQIPGFWSQCAPLMDSSAFTKPGMLKK